MLDSNDMQGEESEPLETDMGADMGMTGGRRRRRAGSRKSRRSRRAGSRKSRRRSSMGGKRKVCPKYCRRKTLRCKTYRRASKKSHRRGRR